VTGVQRPAPGAEIPSLWNRHGGTLFLDEVADLPPPLQAKLLRVIQDKEVWPVGGREGIKVDIRFIVATNRDLWRLVEEGAFREDLYFRLAVIRIQLPPLRERLEDIPLLVDHFLKKYAEASLPSSPATPRPRPTEPGPP